MATASPTAVQINNVSSAQRARLSQIRIGATAEYPVTEEAIHSTRPPRDSTRELERLLAAGKRLTSDRWRPRSRKNVRTVAPVTPVAAVASGALPIKLEEVELDKSAVSVATDASERTNALVVLPKIGASQVCGDKPDTVSVKTGEIVSGDSRSICTDPQVSCATCMKSLTIC